MKRLPAPPDQLFTIGKRGLVFHFRSGLEGALGIASAAPIAVSTNNDQSAAGRKMRVGIVFAFTSNPVSNYGCDFKFRFYEGLIENLGRSLRDPFAVLRGPVQMPPRAFPRWISRECENALLMSDRAKKRQKDDPIGPADSAFCRP